MRICVFGAGAVGGHLAARLAAAGHDVSVVARGAHLEAMRARGIRLLHGEEVIEGKVRTGPPGAQEAVFVTLKANVLPVFAAAAAPLLGPQTPVVFVQNGIPWWYGELPRLDPGGALRRAVGLERALGGVAYSANEVREPGVILNHVPGRNMLVIGEIDDARTPRVARLRQVLEECGMSSPPAASMRAVVWAKLLQNLGTSTLCSLTGATIGEMRSDPALARLAARLGAEGRAIAQALGVDPAAAPERPGGGHASGVHGHKPSMLQDYERGRPMEIEAQVMAPLALGRAAGVATPVLDAVAALVARKARAKGLYAD